MLYPSRCLSGQHKCSMFDIVLEIGWWSDDSSRSCRLWCSLSWLSSRSVLCRCYFDFVIPMVGRLMGLSQMSSISAVSHTTFRLDLIRAWLWVGLHHCSLAPVLMWRLWLDSNSITWFQWSHFLGCAVVVVCLGLFGLLHLIHYSHRDLRL